MFAKYSSTARSIVDREEKRPELEFDSPRFSRRNIPTWDSMRARLEQLAADGFESSNVLTKKQRHSGQIRHGRLTDQLPLEKPKKKTMMKISCHSKNQKKKNDDEDDKVLVSAMNSFSLLHHPLRNLWRRIKEIYN